MKRSNNRKPSIPKSIEPSPRQEGTRELGVMLAFLSGSNPPKVSSKTRVRAKSRPGFRAFAEI